MNSKIVKKAKKRFFTKENLIKIGKSILLWLTKGKVEKNTVLAVAGIAMAAATNFGPTAVRTDVEVVNQSLEQLKPQLDALKEQASWFFIPEEVSDSTKTKTE